MEIYFNYDFSIFGLKDQIEKKEAFSSLLSLSQNWLKLPDEMVFPLSIFEFTTCKLIRKYFTILLRNFNEIFQGVEWNLNGVDNGKKNV